MRPRRLPIPAAALVLFGAFGQAAAQSGAPAGARQPAPASAPRNGESCAAPIAAADRAARDRSAAERALADATRQCPEDAAVWRARAELRLLDSRWRAAALFSRRAAALEPENRRNWDLVGRSRYLAGDVRGALRAWNEIGLPVVSAVEVHGAKQTRSDIVTELIDIRPGELLTADRFIRASRRLDELPVSFNSRLKYSMEDDGHARVRVYLDERAVVPRGPLPIAVVGLGGLAFQELLFDVTAPSGHGEDWTVSWGWEPNWPHVQVGVEVPAPGRLPGIASVTALWERQVIAPAPGLRSIGDRKGLSVSFSNWATSWLRWRAGASLDRFDGGNHAGLQAGLEGRLIRDHAAVILEVGRWTGSRAQPSFRAGTAWLATRSTTRVDMPAWYTVWGIAAADATAPYLLWAGAGANDSSDAFLRAHPLIRHGILQGEVFGRRLEFGSIEYNRPFWQSLAGPVAWAAFVDAARARERAAALGATPLLVDVGVGLRLRPPALAGVLRLDVARGVRDHHWRASIGLMRQWPRR